MLYTATMRGVYWFVSSRAQAAVSRADEPGESAASADLRASIFPDLKCSKMRCGPGSIAHAGVGGERTLSSSLPDGARQGGKEDVTGKSNRGVSGMERELRGVLLARGVLEASLSSVPPDDVQTERADDGRRLDLGVTVASRAVSPSSAAAAFATA